MASRRMKRALQNGLVLLVTIGMGVLALEVGVRVLFPRYTGLVSDRGVWGYDAELGWKGRPNVDLRQRVGDDEVRVRINAQGFRDEDLPFERTPGKQRVVFLGDSMTFGFGVDESSRYGEQLAKIVGNLESMSLGISAYATDQELLIWRLYGQKYQPDFVGLLFVPNDPEFNTGPFGHGHPKPYFVDEGGTLVVHNTPVPHAHWRLRAKYWLQRNCAACNMVRDVLRSTSPALLPRVVDEQTVTGEIPPDVEAQWTMTTKLFLQLKKEVEATGAQFFIATAISHATLESGNHPWNERVLNWCEAKGVHCVGTYGSFVSFREAHGADRLFLPDNHWDVDGHRVAATTMFQALTDWGWLEGTKTSTNATLVHR